MNIDKFNKITEVCTNVVIVINKEAVSAAAGVTAKDILETKSLYEAFGFPLMAMAKEIRDEMIRRNTIVTIIMKLKEPDSKYEISTYSLEHAVEEAYGTLELLGLV